MEKILEEIRQERARQDEKWGGKNHDDAHHRDEWTRFITQKIHDTINPKKYRRRMIQIAALAVAAIESFDRTFEQK